MDRAFNNGFHAVSKITFFGFSKVWGQNLRLVSSQTYLVNQDMPLFVQIYALQEKRMKSECDL